MTAAHRGYLIVEGRGEQDGAVNNLVVRLWKELGLDPTVYWPGAIRGPGLESGRVLPRLCESIRARGDAGLLLILRDEDDACPKEMAPQQATLIEALRLPFPTALVLAEREYESLFLAALPSLAGKPLPVGNVTRPGISADATFEAEAHRVRDAKGWVTQHLAGRGRYKPSVDQLPLTRLVDFDEVRRHGLPWFGTLERALRFLSEGLGGGGVYPPPAPRSE